MSKTRLEWKVGLFVFIGLAVLAVLLIQFSKGVTIFHETYQIHLRSANASGLKRKASVLMAGVQIGTVSNIRLAADGRSVDITLDILNQYDKIYKDARFSMQTSGFLGDQYVSIMPMEPKAASDMNNAGKPSQIDFFRDGDEANAEPPFDIQEFIGSSRGLINRISGTVARLDAVFTNVSQILLNPQTLTNLATAAGNLRTASERAIATLDNVNALLETNGPRTTLTVSNLAMFSGQLNEIAGSVTNLLATNAPALHQTMQNTEAATATLNSVMEDLRAGKGLAGNLLQNDQLATDVSQIANNLSITTSNLNRLGLWGILWQRKPPRTNTIQSANRTLVAPKNLDE